MAETTKALLVVLGIIIIPIIIYFTYFFGKKHSIKKNAKHVDFSKKDGKNNGYIRRKDEAWQEDENLYVEDHFHDTDTHDTHTDTH